MPGVADSKSKIGQGDPRFSGFREAKALAGKMTAHFPVGPIEGLRVPRERVVHQVQQPDLRHPRKGIEGNFSLSIVKKRAVRYLPQEEHALWFWVGTRITVGARTQEGYMRFGLAGFVQARGF